MKGIQEIKLSSGLVNATVWKNVKKDETYRTISFERRYVDKKGNWKSTNTLRVQDLPKITMVLEKAYQRLNLREQFQQTLGD